ncbi:MAG: GNAT family N-acetyltransferase [Candidatus Latescibacterota bacterium]
MQIRSLGPLGFRLARAYVFPSNTDQDFLAELLGQLKKRKVCFARLGNTMYGIHDPHVLGVLRARALERHTFVIDLHAAENVLIHQMKRTARNKIRKGDKDGVRTYEVTDANDLEEYRRLSKATSDRIRQAGSIMEMPKEFFERIFNKMIEKGRAKLIIARHNERLLAGVLCLMHGDSMLAYHAASTRDRDLTAYHGPTACFWRAIRTAQQIGLKWFDFGGCSPHAAKSDSRYGVYFFKSQWGGNLETFYNGEIVFSRLGYQLQEALGKNVWAHAHPLYFKIRSTFRSTR